MSLDSDWKVGIQFPTNWHSHFRGHVGDMFYHEVSDKRDLCDKEDIEGYIDKLGFFFEFGAVISEHRTDLKKIFFFNFF